MEEEELLNLSSDGKYLLTWENLYLLLADEEQVESIPLLELPKLFNARPVITNRGSLRDSNFRISLVSWRQPDGLKVPASEFEYSGAIASAGKVRWLLTKEQFDLLRAIRKFRQREDSQRIPEFHQSMWGEIRRLAIKADAVIDEFLRKTIVLKPENLKLQLKKGQDSDGLNCEIIPSFNEVPNNWLSTFDKTFGVQESYSIPDENGGMIHVVISDEVKAVLKRIKALSQRRMKEQQALAFVRNPFAFLGEGATAVVDEGELDTEVENEFTVYQCALKVSRDSENLIKHVELIFTPLKEGERDASEILYIADDLALFREQVSRSIELGDTNFSWHGFLLRTNDIDVKSLDLVLQAWFQKEAFYLASMTDISQFGDRVIGIGEKQIIQSEFLLKDSKIVWFDLDGKEISVSSDINQISQPLIEFGTDGGIAESSPRKPQHVLLIDSNVDELKSEIDNKRKQETEAAKAKLPKSLKAGISLYDHQRRGIAWLQSLFEDKRAGCILADDMGLGKTIQLLTFIIQHFESTPKREQKPVLVLAPVSLLQNWQNELKRFFENAPVNMQVLHEDGLKSVRYLRDDLRIQGLAEKGLYNVLKEGWRTGNIVLTTYDTLRSYQFSIAREKWFCVICDEAQRIKNPAAMITQAVKAVGSQSDFCIACTGTPVENSLTDLWCLFDFVQPGFLGSLNKDFGPNYQRPIEQQRDGYETVSEELKRKIDPFVLRRLKEDVAQDLPPKNESSPEIMMNDLQKRLYQEAINEYKYSLNRAAHERIRTNPVLTLLRDLRMICAIPVVDVTGNALADSPKMLWLKQKLKEIRDKDEKVIVFTEFRVVQRAVKSMLKECFNLDATIINGETSTSSKKGMTRQGFIDEFQNKDGFNVIILSTTAVGFGVNIQEANHVIHFTRSWNPAKEDQATDRAYRIGQKKTVYVYYPTMISDEYKTFEANIDTLLRRKRELAKDLLAVEREITTDELMSSINQLPHE